MTVDFDGVLTEPWTSPELDGLDGHILLISALSVASARPRPGIRSLVGFLSTFATVEVLTARPSSQAPDITAWLRECIPEIADSPVHSCAMELKPDFLYSEGIALHVDNDERARVSDGPTCIIWGHQTTKELLREACYILSRVPDLRVAGKPVRRLEELPSHSSTPVYRVETLTTSLKLRVVEDAIQSQNLRQIHAVAASDRHLSEMLRPEQASSPTGIHLTEYVPGQSVASRRPCTDWDVSRQVARWLVTLHEATARADGTCLISCACDAFNLCIDDVGAVRIIDAGDACWGARWIDLIWSEQLLGPWIGGSDELFESYMEFATERPSNDDVTRAIAGYYFRLHSVLRSAIHARRRDEVDLRALKMVRHRRATPPTESLLRKWAR
ncbi:hypothetical protein [Rhodococcus sp. KRD162]|uniref:hypothetical protein n=1 Tax=Rhodococcus sp. KRD162 TaxID=2729725 RepID=UPI0019D02133|nr:hypothetical protein [Rhodococcus sp. KRD162]